MAEVFNEERETLSNDYIDQLLSRDEFWAIAAFANDQIVGGITAHTLPMTRPETSEVFIYDVAVRHDQQRKGVGRRLVSELRKGAAANGIHHVFVSVDNADLHALDFYRASGGTPSAVTFFTFEKSD